METKTKVEKNIQIKNRELVKRLSMKYEFSTSFINMSIGGIRKSLTAKRIQAEYDVKNKQINKILDTVYKI